LSEIDGEKVNFGDAKKVRTANFICNNTSAYHLHNRFTYSFGENHLVYICNYASTFHLLTYLLGVSAQGNYA